MHLDEADDLCWAHMVEADLFVLSDSSFSFTPAYFSKGIIVWPGKTTEDVRPLGHWLLPKDLPVALAEIARCKWVV